MQSWMHEQGSVHDDGGAGLRHDDRAVRAMHAGLRLPDRDAPLRGRPLRAVHSGRSGRRGRRVPHGHDLSGPGPVHVTERNERFARSDK